jgi:gamma-glutamyltranspeptidase
VTYEPGAFSETAAAELVEMGHKGMRAGGFGIGDANTIVRSEDGKLEGVSDPRNVGGVAGF